MARMGRKGPYTMETQIDINKIMAEISEKLNKLDGDQEWKQELSNIVERIISEYTN